uniref:Uncharacterized protein n=1 Tax=Oryza glumipatula TaxID=40148 RepID=A0A0E0BGT9_9ORYZ
MAQPSGWPAEGRWSSADRPCGGRVVAGHDDSGRLAGGVVWHGAVTGCGTATGCSGHGLPCDDDDGEGVFDLVFSPDGRLIASSVY